MRLHYLQHAPFEDAGNIALWATERGHSVSHTRLDLDEDFPRLEEFDWLVIMGGPMSAYEEERYAWLVREKEFIRKVIDRGVPTLGVCLGAQLIAEVLGGRVKENHQKEIGWFPVYLTDEGRQSPLFAAFPRCFVPFHWHGDTFSIPPGAARIAWSEACVNQAFVWRKAVGLQFHLEYSAVSIQRMIHEGGEELVDGPSIQKADQMLPCNERIDASRRLLYQLLDAVYSGM